MATVVTHPIEQPKLSCTQALDHAYALALEKLPGDTHKRLAKALALVQAGQVFESDHGYWEVASQSEGGSPHNVNGTCDCAWQHFNPGEYCMHRLAVALQRKTMLLLTQTPPDPARTAADAPTEALAPEAARHEAVQGIDPKFIVWIQGRPFVRHAGLLTLAHARGLQSLTVQWTYNDADLSLAHAVAVFADGRRFEESADSTPLNVGKKVALHWRRLSLTRASARALRLALGVDLVALEELAEE